MYEFQTKFGIMEIYPCNGRPKNHVFLLRKTPKGESTGEVMSVAEMARELAEGRYYKNKFVRLIERFFETMPEGSIPSLAFLQINYTLTSYSANIRQELTADNFYAEAAECQLTDDDMSSEIMLVTKHQLFLGGEKVKKVTFQDVAEDQFFMKISKDHDRNFACLGLERYFKLSITDATPKVIKNHKTYKLTYSQSACVNETHDQLILETMQATAKSFGCINPILSEIITNPDWLDMINDVVLSGRSLGDFTLSAMMQVSNGEVKAVIAHSALDNNLFDRVGEDDTYGERARYDRRR